MLRTLLTLLLLSLGSMAAYAQAPGYLGKRITLQGEFHSFPAIIGPTSSNRGLQTYSVSGDETFGLNWSAGARLGYVLSRYKQLVLSFDYLKTGVTQTAYLPTGVDYTSRELFYNLQGLTFGIGTRKFNSGKGGLAPMGIYSGFSLQLTALKGKLNKEFSPDNTPLSAYGIEANHLVPSLGYEFGTNFIIKDKLLLNVGAKLNFALSPRAFRYALGEDGLWDPNSNEKGLNDGEGNTDNFKSVAAARYALHSVLMIYVGVGLLQ
jgi:hypothetical protein